MNGLNTTIQKTPPSFSQSNQEDQNDTGGDYLTPYTAGLFHLTDKSDLMHYASKFDLLPPAIKKILFDFSTAEFIEEKVGVKFNLDKTQKKEIAHLIREVLLGNIFIGDFTKCLQTNINIDGGRAKDIASMIVGNLFPPALESIKAAQRTKFPDRVTAMREEAKSPSPINKPPAIGGDHPTEEQQFKVLNLGPQEITGSQKSLDEELEKVANVIDLRNK